MSNPIVKHTSFEMCSSQCVFVGWLHFNSRLLNPKARGSYIGAIPFCRRLIVCLADRKIIFLGEISREVGLLVTNLASL